ncbi:MAG: hypothetical protein WC756_03770 [Taibaiella sp.]|jgi:hypothetical protein
MIYESIPQYIECFTLTEDRINRLELILTQMENSMLMVAANPELGTVANTGVNLIEEYSLDDGQTKIRTKYRDTEAFIGSYKTLLALKDMLIAKLNNNITGRVFSLRDGRNFTR